LKNNAFNRICSSFNNKESIGSLCQPLCYSNTLQLIDCPNIDGHNGKDYVFVAKLDDKKIVLKARTLTIFELIGNNKWKNYFKNDRQRVLKAINQIISQRFDYPKNETTSQTNSHLINKLISWPIDGLNNYLNETSLINIWLLIQDNEFVLSKTYQTLFPPIVGSCGHFYGVQYADDVLDFSYFLPQFLPFMTQTLLKRIEVGLKVIEFLIRFESAKPKLELCDIKFEHFGYIDEQLLLIDSDMIYPKKTVIDSIESLSHCDRDDDCDFIDCKGICVAKNKCVIDQRDDDLMRVCRNMFFMGKLYGLFDFGLFYDQRIDIQNEFDLIKIKCYNRSVLSSDINQIHSILLNMKNKLIK